MKKRTSPIVPEATLREMFASGMSLKQVSAETGYFVSNLSNITTGLGLRWYKGYRPKPSTNEAQLGEMAARGMTTLQISESLGMPRETISRMLTIFGISVPKSKPRKRMRMVVAPASVGAHNPFNLVPCFFAQQGDADRKQLEKST